MVKITPKQFGAFKHAARAGITYNDGYNKQEFGITHAQYSAILRVVEAIAGMEWRDVTLAHVNAFLAGQKVGGARADNELVEKVRAAFGARKNPSKTQRSEPQVYLAQPSGARGRWVDASDDDALQAAIEEITNGGRGDWQIHDYNDMPNLGENPDIEDVSKVAGWIEEHGFDVVKATIDKVGRQYLDEAERLLEGGFAQYDSLEDYVDSLIEEKLISTETLLQYVDTERLARDLDIGGDINSVELPKGGVLVFNES